MRLKFPFSEIPETGAAYEFSDESWLPADCITAPDSVAVEVRLLRLNENRVELVGELRAEVELACDLCLEKYFFSVRSPMRLLLEVSGDDRWRLQNIDSAEGELETLALESPVVELDELLREQLLLALPEKKLCRTGCLGLCPRCGADLNVEKCRCPEKKIDSPFSVLAGLKKK
ncbi:MAG: hypothetical protein Kow0089_04860 [Desulfobulbaceae bacterium]